MGAIDLVVQIESPPSVASGLQRIGRAGHRIDEVSTGIVFPKFRGDLVACAAVTSAMMRGEVEPSRYPRNPLDVLAQQLVAMASVETWGVDDLFDAVRGAAPYAELSRRVFDGVLDMLSGRYPSDEFAELQAARHVGSRQRDDRRATGRQAGGDRQRRHDSRPRALRRVPARRRTRPRARRRARRRDGVRGARRRDVSARRVHLAHRADHARSRDRVAGAGPAGQDAVLERRGGRPADRAGLRHRQARARAAQGRARGGAQRRLEQQHGLDALAAANLLQYLDDQERAVQAVPDDRTLRDRAHERRARRLARARAVVARQPRARAVGDGRHGAHPRGAGRRRRDRCGATTGSWCGCRKAMRRPTSMLLVPDPDEVEGQILRQLGSTALFAARFREAAGRALLLPRRRPGARAPLWQQRKRAADLLSVAARFGSFPIILETYRECLRDVFDLPALVDVLRRIRSRTLRVATVESRTPSPFAASLLFNYVANYIYEGDAPLAERRAQALAVDQSQLRELIGDAELRDLLDLTAIEAVEADLQYLPERFHAKSTDAVHDLLLRLGDLTRDEIAARAVPGIAGSGDRRTCSHARRAIELPIAGDPRLVAVEYAARYRDALGTPLPPGLPAAFLEPSADAIGDLIKRYARTHGPFTAGDIAARFGLPIGADRGDACAADRHGTTGRRRVSTGRPRPRVVRSRCAAQHPPTVARAAAAGSRAGRGAGARPLSPRLARHRPSARRAGRAARHHRAAAGRAARRVAPRARDSPGAARRLLAGGARHAAGRRRGVVGRRRAARRSRRPHRALPHRSSAAALAATWTEGFRGSGVQGSKVRNTGTEARPDREPEVLERLRETRRVVLRAAPRGLGGGFPKETLDALWSLVWKGLVTNDTLHALRAYLRPPDRARRPGRMTPFRSRRLVPPSAEGRWTAITGRQSGSLTEWAATVAQQLLTRHGVVDPRCHRARTGPRRIQHGVSGPAPVGRNRPRAPRLFRERPRRGAVRAAGRGGPAARRARRAGASDRGHARRHRPGESVRRGAAVARLGRAGCVASAGGKARRDRRKQALRRCSGPADRRAPASSWSMAG